MILLVGVAAILLTVRLAGGSLALAGDAELRSRWAMGLSVGAQVAMQSLADGWLPRTLHISSFALVLVFVVRNRTLPGSRRIGAGAACNLAAVAANGGVMPASPWAWAISGAPHLPADAFANARPLASAHLAALGDVLPFPLGLPSSAPFSLGDVLVLAGLAVCLHTLSGSRWASGRAAPALAP